MIVRTVFVKLREDLCTPAGRAEFAATSQKALASIPGVISAEGGPAADEASTSAWDVAMLVRFADMDAVETYRVHPIHLKYLEEVMKPAAVFKKVWNFKV